MSKVVGDKGYNLKDYVTEKMTYKFNICIHYGMWGKRWRYGTYVRYMNDEEKKNW